MTRFHAATLCTALLLLGGACQKDGAVQKAKPAKVIVQKVEVSDVPIYAEFVGTIDGFQNAEIRARTPGYVEKVHYTEGSPVKKGDLLFTIDPILAQASVTSASGALEGAKAVLAKTDADLARVKPLFASGAASRMQLDDAVAAQQAATARLLAMQGSLQTASANLSYTKIQSPIDGVAGLAKVRIGNLVGQSEPTLLTTVSTLDPVRVRFAISENQYLKIADRLAELQVEAAQNPNREGQLVLMLADGREYPHKGRVAVIERQIDISTGTLAFEALFPNPDQTLRPGQFAKVRARADTKHGVVLVPQRAVRELQGTQMIGVVGADNKVEMRTVIATDRVGSNWVVDKGLKGGDRVVVEGLLKARPGEVVEVEERAPQAANAAAAPTNVAGEGH
jgi:membrane fusion protein (multidrug efflux system)